MIMTRSGTDIGGRGSIMITVVYIVFVVYNSPSPHDTTAADGVPGAVFSWSSLRDFGFILRLYPRSKPLVSLE